MADFGSDYEKTINGFPVICEVCGSRVISVTSENNQKDSYDTNTWKHCVEYNCGAEIYYKAGFGSERDYRLRKRCTEAHDIALALKKKVEAAQTALDKG